MIHGKVPEPVSIDDELMLNRILDSYGEAARPKMDPVTRERFDRLTPDVRRQVIINQINKVAESNS